MKLLSELEVSRVTLSWFSIHEARTTLHVNRVTKLSALLLQILHHVLSPHELLLKSSKVLREVVNFLRHYFAFIFQLLVLHDQISTFLPV